MLTSCGRPCYLRYTVQVAAPVEEAHARFAAMPANAALKLCKKVAKSNPHELRVVDNLLFNGRPTRCN